MLPLSLFGVPWLPEAFLNMVVPSVSISGVGSLQSYSLWQCCTYACVGEWCPCLCTSVLSHSPVNGRVLLWGCISMNVYSLHKEHGQCSGTWESRHRFQAAALTRILPSGFAPLCPWSSVEERHDPNRSLLEKSDWAMRYLWPGLNILW